MKVGLSKSKYVTYCNCAKALWLKTYKKDKEEIDAGVQSRFEMGSKVGDLAMEYFGKYVEVTTYDKNGNIDLKEMIKKTNDEIAKGTKVICEALFPKDPSLNYKNLKGTVHNGGEATNIFPLINDNDMTKAEQKEARESLLRYCELDTYAMVKVLEKLYELAR